MKPIRLFSLFVMIVAVSACASPNGAARGDGDAPQYVNARVINDAVALNRTSSDADPNEILCKRMPITGSRLKRMICGTRAQWEAVRLQSEIKYREIISQNTIMR